MWFAGFEDPADVLNDGPSTVPHAGRAAGAGLGGFGCTGWQGALHAEVPEPPSHPGRGEFVRLSRPFPGAAEVGDQATDEAELSVRGDDQPGPSVGGLRIADFRAGPAEGLLDHSEGVLKIESPQECVPEPVDIHLARAGARPPQPDWLGVRTVGQTVDLESDHGALDDRQLVPVGEPGRTPGQPWVEPVEGSGHRGAVPLRLRDRPDIGLAPGVRLAEDELTAVF